MQIPNKVFFSYARADGAFVLKLASDLRDAGIDLWLDQLDIPVGEQWDRAVEAALHACASFLIVLSPASVSSENVLDEASYAIQHDKQIVPILVQPCQVPFRLSRLQYIDFTGDYQQALARTVAVLKGGTSARIAMSAAEVLRETGPQRRIGTGTALMFTGLLTGAAVAAFLLRDAMTTPGADQSAVVAAAVEVTSVPVTAQDTEADPQNLEQQLRAANITLSDGDPAQAREWLASDPAYVALANSCLEVMAGQRLTLEVQLPLDVINAHYMESMGVSPSGYLEAARYRDLDRIRQAIFAAWRERLPNTGRSSFTDIVETR